MRVEVGQEGFPNGVENSSHFANSVIPFLTTWGDGGVVCKVQIPLDLEKPLPWYSRGDGEVVESFSGGPVVIQVRELCHAHQDAKPKVGSDLLLTCAPVLYLSTSRDRGRETGGSVPVCLCGDVLDELRSEELEEHVCRICSDRYGWTNISLTTTSASELDHSCSSIPAVDEDEPFPPLPL